MDQRNGRSHSIKLLVSAEVVPESRGLTDAVGVGQHHPHVADHRTRRGHAARLGQVALQGHVGAARGAEVPR
eukprot:6218224-Pyramimonas_sp.AAC.1